MALNFRLAAYCLLTALMGFAAMAEDKVIIANPVSFANAVKNSTRYDADKKVQAYRHKQFAPFVGEHMDKAMSDCAKKLGKPSDDAFTFILTIADNGDVVRIDLSRSTNLSVCLAETLANEKFPAPPIQAFSEEFDMKFKP